MKIIEPSYQIIDPENRMPPTRKIELVGRSCYKSEDKITDTSAVPFVKRLIQNKHEAMLEHASVLFAVSQQALETLRRLCCRFEEATGQPCFIRRSGVSLPTSRPYIVVSGNVRAWRDLIAFADESEALFPVGASQLPGMYPELFFDCPRIYEHVSRGRMTTLSAHELLESHCPQQAAMHYPLTVRFTVDIAVARELCRHRLASHAGASTRYCDYANGKFGSETTVVMPSDPFSADWVRSARYAEEKYLAQRQEGIAPEIARSALTLSTMAEHTMTATLAQWKHIFDLRALDKTGKAHPQMKQVMLPLYRECKALFPEVFTDMDE